MSSKDFLRQRISAYLGKDIDPGADAEVQAALRSKFNIRLPQRRSLDDSLKATISDHEVVALILEYRSTTTS
jgi:hypothetical protein